MDDTTPRAPAALPIIPRRRPADPRALLRRRAPRRQPLLPLAPRRRSRTVDLSRTVARSDLHAVLVTLARRGRGRTVREGDVVVRAHREHAGRFALDGYPGVPDAGDVRAVLAKLVARGLVARPRPRCYRVTAEGMRVAASGDLRAAARARRVARVRASPRRPVTPG